MGDLVCSCLRRVETMDNSVLTPESQLNQSTESDVLEEVDGMNAGDYSMNETLNQSTESDVLDEVDGMNTGDDSLDETVPGQNPRGMGIGPKKMKIKKAPSKDKQNGCKQQ